MKHPCYFMDYDYYSFSLKAANQNLYRVNYCVRMKPDNE